jgi:membrane-associated phospholipid phosphatase
MLAGVVAALLGYAGYLLVPAVGPYVYQASLFPTRLPGGERDTHFFIAAIDGWKGVARDCFPSLHSAHNTVVLAFARRFRRWAFALYLPIGLGLYVSTVYLRMHYVVDVVAGVATGAAAVWLAPRINRRWRAGGAYAI